MATAPNCLAGCQVLPGSVIDAPFWGNDHSFGCAFSGMWMCPIFGRDHTGLVPHLAAISQQPALGAILAFQASRL
jgi:hypothetical protein